MTPDCHDCGRALVVGESAWADDWIVIEAGLVRVETRYRCDDCEESR